MSIYDEISIVIPTKNEEKGIEKCLVSVSDFKSIYVVDSLSKDKTKLIAENFGANVIDFNWDNKYPKKRNWFLENVDIPTQWVLFLDADEIVSEEFLLELEKKFDKRKDGYMLYYQNYFLGRKMRFGLKQRKLALINKHFRFERIESEITREFDMEIHEHPVGLTDIDMIRSKIDHDDYRGVLTYIQKHLHYSQWEVERYKNLKGDEKLTVRQRFKYKMLGWSLFPVMYFVLDYFLLLRILDGKVGFSYSLYKMMYFNLIRDQISGGKS